MMMRRRNRNQKQDFVVGFVVVVVSVLLSSLPISVHASNLRVTNHGGHVLAPEPPANMEEKKNISSLDELVEKAMRNADASIQEFESYDTNLDGYLTPDEFPGDNFEEIDQDGDGKISSKEFAKMFPSESDMKNRAIEEANELFDSLDTNKNGFLSKVELEASEVELPNVESADTNQDGKISRSEFIEYYKQSVIQQPMNNVDPETGEPLEEEKAGEEEVVPPEEQGVKVVIVNLPHEPLERDYKRVSAEVARVLKDSGLPKNGNTNCACRLLTPRVRCACENPVFEAQKEAEKKKNSKNKLTPDEQADRDALKEAFEKSLRRVRTKYAKKEASKRWGEAQNEDMKKKIEIEKHRNLDTTYWSKEYNRTQTEADERLGDELENMMRARAARLAELSEDAQAAAEKAAAELAARAREGMLAHRDAAQVAAQDLKRRLALDSRNLQRKKDEIEKLKEALQLLRENNAMNAAEIQRNEDLHNKLQSMLAEALADAKRRIAEALAKLKAQYESMIADACGQPCKDLMNQITKLQAQLKAMRDQLNGGGSGDTGLENMLDRLRRRIQAEMAALERMEREQSSPCEVDADCELSERCHETSRLCLSVLENTKCFSHRMCGNGQLCNSSSGNKKKQCEPVSVEEGARCRMPWSTPLSSSSNNNDLETCAVGQRCVLGVCRSYFRGSTCRFHSNCGYGQHCVSGKCEWLTPADGAKCVDSNECAPSHKCSSGKCFLVLPGSKCRFTKNCGNGMLCLSNRCQIVDPPEGTPCAQASDCGPGQGCETGRCTALFEGTRCESDTQCGFSQRCDENGLCHYVERDEDECTSDENCGNGMRCESKSCIGEKLEGSKCKQTSECRVQQSCIDGNCVTVGLEAPCLDVKDCGKGMTCGGKHHRCIFNSGDEVTPGGGCGDDSECLHTQVCVQSTCTDVPTEFDSCTKSGKSGWAEARCGNNQRCESGLCSPFYSVTAPTGGALCKTTKDCSNGQKCGRNKRCKIMYNMPCEKTADCGNGQFCNAGVCVTDGVPCDTSGDCVTWQACVGGQCSTVEIDAPCEWTADCGNEQVCDEDESKCVVAPSGNGAICDKENPCSDGFRCTDKSCTYNPVSSSCFSDMECAVAQSCVNNMCMWRTPPDGTPCTKFSDCGHGQRCLSSNKKCESVSPGSKCGKKGDVSSLCGNGQMCSSGTCLDVPQGSQCGEDDKTCGLHQECTSARKCLGKYHRVGLILDGTSCKESDQCGDSQICRLDRCRTIAKGSMCNDHSDCGNGQSCSGEHSRTCVALRLGEMCDASESTCGNNMRCVQDRCVRAYGFDSMDFHHSTPSYAKCFSHVDCAFGYRCVEQRCSPVGAGSGCSSNGDCGNGERCDSRTMTCEVVKERAQCKAPKDCANGQVCDRGECRGVYGRGVSSEIEDGSNCNAHEDCGKMQRCERLKCRTVSPGLQCVNTEDTCGNGQMCNLKGSCDEAREGVPCDGSPESCGLSQSCVRGLCRGQYGRTLDIEIHRRMSEDWTMQNEWQHLVQSRIEHLQDQVRAEMNINNTIGLSTAKAVLKLREERKRLEEGRKTLEAELQRRTEFAAPSDGSTEWESLFAKAQDDIRRLQDEIVRLKAEREHCRKNNDDCVPTFEEDLTFQIEKIEEEVARRRAQLARELQRIKSEVVRISAALKECQERATGCPPDEEQEYKLQLMHAEQELRRRQNAARSFEELVIYKCLYTHHEDPTSQKAEEMLLKRDQLSVACADLMSSKGVVSEKIEKCVCAGEKRMEEVRVQIEADEKNAENVYSAIRKEKMSEKEASKMADEEAARLAEDEAKELLWETTHLQSDWEEKLKRLQEEHKDLIPSIRDRLMKENELRDGESNSGRVYSEDEVKKCLESSSITGEAERNQLLDTFKDTSSTNPCSLLSLTANPLLQRFHTCLCDE